jgi:hypothetical protein
MVVRATALPGGQGWISDNRRALKWNSEAMPTGAF